MKRSRKKSRNTAACEYRVFIAAVVVAAALAGCAAPAPKEESEVSGPYRPADKHRIHAMLECVAAFNRKAPAKLSADFAVSGTFQGKQYRIMGTARFDRGRDACDVVFTDAIFRSPLAEVVQNGEEIRIYYPVEKKLYIDRRSTLDLSRYGVDGLDFSILYELITGVIPMPGRYTVKKGLEAREGDGSLLILENPTYYQTISFIGCRPDRLLVVKRNNGERFEVYLKKPIEQAGSEYFGTMTIHAPQSRISLNILFSRVAINVPVNVRSVRELKTHPHTRVVTM